MALTKKTVQSRSLTIDTAISSSVNGTIKKTDTKGERISENIVIRTNAVLTTFKNDLANFDRFW
ncbi:MAG: hypothetical protein EOP48_22410 [Sphingobacteriales bacterium]|nr:MAG: hypothetical protein EOP48_22410 [Sphingobacteriales bacterium]